MPEELYKLVVGLGLSLIVSFIIVVPVIIWRILKRKPLLPKGEKMESPTPFYIGIILFGGLALASFLTSTPYFGTALLLMSLACVFGLIAFKKGKI
jgi:hypothetical protein